MPILATLRALARMPSNRSGPVPSLLGLAVAAVRPQWPQSGQTRPLHNLPLSGSSAPKAGISL